MGLLRRSEFCGAALSISRARDLPKASTLAPGASASGKCSRVPDATPSGLWQAGHPAFWSMGYTDCRKYPGSTLAARREGARSKVNQNRTQIVGYFILSAGSHPLQETTGSRGYFGNRGSLSERPHRKKVDPRSEVMIFE